MALVGMVFLTFGIDYLLRLDDRILRALLMVASLGGVGYVAYRMLITPLRVPMQEESLALLVEHKWHDLKDRLISAIQFSKARELPPGASPAMVLKMADEANELAERLEFSEIIQRRTMYRVMVGGLLAVLLLCGFAYAQSGLMNTWFNRNVLLSDKDPWPQDTYLVVAMQTSPTSLMLLQDKHHDPQVVRGDDLTLKVSVDERRSKVTPEVVVCHVKYATLDPVEIPANLNADRMSYTITLDNVSEEFEFYIVGGDDHRDKKRPHRIRLIERPALRNLKYTIHYPAYMNRRASSEAQVSGIMTVPVGSTIAFKGECNKDLKSVETVLDGERAGASSFGKDKRSVEASVEITGNNAAAVRSLNILLTDTDDHKSKNAAYQVQVQADLRPIVEVKPRGIGVLCTPNAKIPVLIHVTDDYGVGKVVLSVVTPKMGAASTQPAATQATTGPAATAPVVEVKLDPIGQKEYTLVEKEPGKPLAYDLLDLVRDNFVPKPGDVIQVVAMAEDQMNISGGPNSNNPPAVYELRVVSIDDLRTDLLTRQRDLYMIFGQALPVQAGAQAKTAGVATAISDKLPDNARSELNDSIRDQRSLSGECARTADLLDAVYSEMVANRLYEDNQDIYRDLAAVVQAFKGFYPRIQDVAASLTKVVEEIDTGKADPAKTRETLLAAADEQKRLLDEMTEAHRKIYKGTGVQDFINNTSRILEMIKQIDTKLKTTGPDVFKPTDSGSSSTKPSTAPAK